MEQKDGYDCIILKNTTVSIQNSDKAENPEERAGKMLVYIMQNVKSAVHTYSDKGGVQGMDELCQQLTLHPEIRF